MFLSNPDENLNWAKDHGHTVSILKLDNIILLDLKKCFLSLILNI